MACGAASLSNIFSAGLFSIDWAISSISFWYFSNNLKSASISFNRSILVGLVQFAEYFINEEIDGFIVSSQAAVRSILKLSLPSIIQPRKAASEWFIPFNKLRLA